MIDNSINNQDLAVGTSLPDWQARPTPARAAMTGRYCRVEPLQLEMHAKQLYQAFSEDELQSNWTYLAYGPFNDFDSFYQWLLKTTCADDPLFFVIIDNATSCAVGMASYLRIEPAVGVIEVGHIHFSPSLQKTPMATEAMYLMMRRVFNELGYRRYEWKCDACNEGSKKAAARLGFQFEGVFRQATVYKGRNRDTAWFSILDKEWPAMKAAFEQWLEQTNFDDDGKQQRSLKECYS